MYKSIMFINGVTVGLCSTVLYLKTSGDISDMVLLAFLLINAVLFASNAYCSGIKDAKDAYTCGEQSTVVLLKKDLNN